MVPTSISISKIFVNFIHSESALGWKFLMSFKWAMRRFSWGKPCLWKIFAWSFWRTSSMNF